MYPITSITVAAAAFLATFSNALPATTATPAGTLSLIFSNFTLNTPQSLCGTNPKDLTLGAAQLNQCISLGNTYTRFQIESVGSGISENCIIPASKGCSVQGPALSLTEPPEKICLGTVDSFTEILYTSDCPTGSGG